MKRFLLKLCHSFFMLLWNYDRFAHFSSPISQQVQWHISRVWDMCHYTQTVTISLFFCLFKHFYKKNCRREICSVWKFELVAKENFSLTISLNRSSSSVSLATSANSPLSLGWLDSSFPRKTTGWTSTATFSPVSRMDDAILQQEEKMKSEWQLRQTAIRIDWSKIKVTSSYDVMVGELKWKLTVWLIGFVKYWSEVEAERKIFI